MVKQEERNNSNRLRGIEIESYRSMGWWQESFKSTKRNYLFNLDNRRGEKKLIKTLYKLISRELRREFVWQGPTSANDLYSAVGFWLLEDTFERKGEEGTRGKVKRGFPKGPKKMVCSPSSLLFAPTLRVLIEIEGESFQCGVGHT